MVNRDILFVLLVAVVAIAGLLMQSKEMFLSNDLVGEVTFATLEKATKITGVINATLARKDSDTDGLTDYQETKTYETDPNDTDTDNDGLSDYEEVNRTSGYTTDPLDYDSDNDGCSDGHEVLYADTDPTLFGDCIVPPPE